MLKIELNELSAEQVKQIRELKSMGVPDEIIQIGIDNENKKLTASKASEVVQMNNKYEKIFGRELVEEKHFVFRGLEKIHNKSLCNEEEAFMNPEDISGEINGFISKITVEMNNNIEEAVVEIVRAYNPNNTTYEVNAKKIREALEKQILKKPIETVKIEPLIAENGAYVDADTYVLLLCPLCGEQVGLDDLCDKFCRECGQAIDWSEEVEE